MIESSPKYDFFISATNQDSGFAWRLKETLEARGYKIFFDPGGNINDIGMGNLEAGAKVASSIEQNLLLSRYMILLLSSTTAQSGWVQVEIDIRKTLDNKRGSSTILPVYLDQQAEKDWESSLGYIRTARTCLDGDVDMTASRIMETAGLSLSQLGKEALVRSPPNIGSVLESIVEPSLEVIFDNLRLSLALELKRLVAEMENEGTCKLSMAIYYDIVVDVLEQVRDGGTVHVTNILWHQEWKDTGFVRDYLEEEARLIQERGLRVERFFIGTPSLFDSLGVRHLIHRNRVAGVIVRCLYVTEDMKSEQASNIFDWDIGIYETTPRCFVQGHHRSGYLIYGTVGTASSTYKRLRNAFERYEKLACRPRERDVEEDRALQKSVLGWRQPYFDHSQPAWQAEPCPMVEEKIGFLIQRAIKQRYDAGDHASTKIVLVDAGCGDGRNLQFLANLCCSLVTDGKSPFEFELVGVDLCDSAVKQARERLHQMELPHFVTWRTHERNIVDELPVVSEGADILVCTDTFGQIYASEVPHALSEWRRALRRSGTILLNAYTPEDDTLKHCEREAEGNRLGSQKDSRYENAWWYKNTYYKYYKRQELLALMRDAKFAVVSLEDRQWLDPPHPGYREEEHIHKNWVVVAERAD
ncbi:MAG TPA: TIR domain-containing protein [Pyrinomonadaceae bacterium]|jgi:ubiquinone/menaquinone biosynthesis C-methylase UbiE